MNALVNPWIVDDGEKRFVLDVEAFLEKIEAPPAFLDSPSPEYLKAAEIIPMLQVLADVTSGGR